MSLDLFTNMQSFVAVVDKGGFASAALYLHISTPVLTKQIQRLEEYLGKKLLTRTTRRLDLTEHGEIYLQHAKKILAEVTEAKNQVLGVDHEPHGEIKVGYPIIFDAVFPIKQLRQFLQKYPKIKISIIAENSPNALITDFVDLVISTIDLHDKQFIKEHLYTGARSILASPDYIKKHGKPKFIADLKNHNCLINKRVYPTGEWIFMNHRKIKVNGNYQSDLSLDLIFAAADGLGIVCAPNIVADQEIKNKKLVCIKLESDPLPVKLFVYYKPNTYHSNVKLIANYIKTHVSN